MGGRGAGKTRAGSEWVRSEVEGNTPLAAGRSGRVALLAETYDQARGVMIEGDSGILACSPPDRRPEWQATRRRLKWPNGATAEVFSAHDYEGLRGPQFDAAWSDELAKWRDAQAAWDMLQFALRLGEHPRQMVTTTPRNVTVLKTILASPTTVVTHAPTEANAANLAESFLADVRDRYAGTRLAQQELDGILLDDIDGALWTAAMLEAARLADAFEPVRVVVAVDPPVTSHAKSDACGIIVAGASTSGPPTEWRARVLQDTTVEKASPQVWAEAAVEAFHRHKADRIVAEVNQGGDLVLNVIRQVDPQVPVRSVRANRGKATRAEPVSALYEQGRVSHVDGLDLLEAEMGQFTAQGFKGSASPDRVDALVWALTELMIEPARAWRNPSVRSLF